MRIPIAALALSASAAADAGSFHAIVEYGGVAGLSRNGRIAIGVIATGLNGATSWRWTRETGLEVLPGFLDASGASTWTQPIAGAVLDGDANEVAAIAYSDVGASGPIVIGPYPEGIDVDGYKSSAYGVSDDGIAVGLAYDKTGHPIAFRWTAADGMTRLPVNRPDTFSRANGISRDGRTVYGWNDQPDGYRSGVIWRDGAPLDLVDGDGLPIGEALGASGDGRVVVGGGYYTANGSEAWRWTAATGVVPIGILPSSVEDAARAPTAVSAARLDRKQPDLGLAPDGFLPPESFAFAVSDDGDIVVGASGVWPIRTASVWTPDAGLEALADYAAARGTAIPDGWALAAATAISADGRTIGGWGIDPEGLMHAFVLDLRDEAAPDAIVEAHGTVAANNLDAGPFADIAAGAPVTLSFAISPDGVELAPGRATRYPIRLETLRLRIGDASETLAPTVDGPGLTLTNDDPRADGIAISPTPTASGQTFALELEAANGDLFDSDDSDRIDRGFGPEHFSTTSWRVADGDRALEIRIDSVGLHDLGDPIFSGGFDP